MQVTLTARLLGGASYAANSTDGECMASWASIKKVALLYDPNDSASFHPGRWNNGTNPDLAFAFADSNSCFPDRGVLEKFPGRNIDHR